MTDIPALYVVRHAIYGQWSLYHAPSIAAVQAWADQHNLIMGTPAEGVPFFSVEHADGSPLTKTESDLIANAASEANYIARMRTVISSLGMKKYPHTYDPYAGAAHSIMGRASNRGEW